MDIKNILYNQVYVVIMRRWGSDEAHHYIRGVYTNIDAANEAGQNERESRGGKYEYVVYAYDLNSEYAQSGDYCVSSSMSDIILDSNRDMILEDDEAFRKVLDSEARRNLYERKYQLERDLKIVKRQLSERKKL